MRKRARSVTSCLLALVVTLGVILVSGQPALATGGYPYAHYNGPGTNPSLFIWTDATGDPASPYGFYYRNCTDFVAWKLNATNGLSFHNSTPHGVYGNAKDWGNIARANGYTVDLNPAPGSVAWWGPSAFGMSSYGHVAWVESVSGDTVTIQEYNNPGGGTFGTRTINKGSVSGYIHFKDLASGPLVPPYVNRGTDIDGNGASDLVVTTREGDNTIGVQVGLSTYGNFMGPVQWWRDQSFDWAGVTPLVGDVNGDHLADYVFLTNEGVNGTKAWVARSSGRGFYAPELWWHGPSYGYTGIKLALGDLDYNDAKDLLLLTRESDGSAGLQVALSNKGGFYPPVTWWRNSTYGWAGTTLLAGNVNGPLALADDVVLLTDEGANGTKAWVMNSSGIGLYPPGLWWHGPGYGYSGIKAVLGDVDYHDDKDLILTTREADGTVGVQVALSTQTGFIPPVQWLRNHDIAWDGVKALAGNVNGTVGKADDLVLIAREVDSSSKAWVARSSGRGFYTPELWWNGSSYGYSGIKVALG